MTTQRNLMFYNRGMQFILDYISRIADSVETLEEFKSKLDRFKSISHQSITDCSSDFVTSSLETKFLVTNHYNILFSSRDRKYTIIQSPMGEKIETIILWSENTDTQCIIDLYGDSIIEDKDIEENIANLVGIADDWEVLDRPLFVKITGKTTF